MLSFLRITSLTFFLFVISFYYTDCSAQSKFQKIYYNSQYAYPREGIIDIDGNYIIVGTAWAAWGNTLYSIFLLKLDSTGEMIWYKEITDFSISYWASSIVLASDGSYIIGGSREDGLGGEGLLIKMDINGSVLWAKTINAPITDSAYAAEGIDDIAVTSNENIITIGTTNAFSLGTDDVFIVRLDTNGGLLWSAAIGNNYISKGSRIIPTSDNGCIFLGEKEITSSNQDIYVGKLDSVGNLLWSKLIGGIKNDKGYSISKMSDNTYLIGGETQSFGSGGYDGLLLKIDDSGDIKWAKTYGTSNIDQINSIRPLQDGGCLIIGGSIDSIYNNGDVICYRIDSAGNIKWLSHYGLSLSASGKDAIIDKNSLLVLGAILYQATPSIYIVKADSMGNSSCYENSDSITVLTANPVIGNVSDNINIGSIMQNISIPVYDFTSFINTNVLCYTGINTENNYLSNTVNIRVNPNPNSGQFYIKAENPFNGTIAISDIAGRMVYKEMVQFHNNYSMSISHLISGIYFLKLYYLDDVLIKTIKIVLTN